MGHKGLRLGQIVYILVFYNISFSWLLPLDGFQFIFLLRDSENDLFSQLATSFVVKGLNVGGKTHSSKGTDSLYQCYFLVVCEPLNNSSRSLIPFTANVFTVKTKQSTILTTSSNLELK